MVRGEGWVCWGEAAASANPECSGMVSLQQARLTSPPQFCSLKRWLGAMVGDGAYAVGEYR